MLIQSYSHKRGLHQVASWLTGVHSEDYSAVYLSSMTFCIKTFLYTSYGQDSILQKNENQSVQELWSIWTCSNN